MLMYAPLSSAETSPRVLFLARSESSVRMDMSTLRSLGVTALTQRSTSSAALAFLEQEHAAPGPSGHAVDLVICDEQLGDLPASAFLYRLAQLPAMQTQPALVLSGSSSNARALRAAGVYVLERPYTPQDLARMIHKAMSPKRRLLRPTLFEAAAERKKLPLQAKEPPKPRAVAKGPMTTSDWFQKGQEHLAANDLSPAEYAFLQVLQRQEDHVEACLGLARVHKARKDGKAMRRALLRAAAACTRQGDKPRAEAIIAVLPESMRGNIFMHEAIALMEENAYRHAALSFLDADRTSPEVPLHRIVSRACLLMPKPDESLTRVCEAFESVGHKAIAHALRRRLLSYSPYEEQGVPSWLDKYPKLKEAVSVAGYAAWAWKQV